MVAVTGTSGKTSVASFTRQIWEAGGHAAASIGTTGVVAPGRNDYGSLTTPDPVELHKLLTELADAGVTHAAMEASSHGLDQRRLDGVRLSAAGFTNLGRDHMDYHPTVEDYLRAKLRLFDTLLPKGAPAVIFADDQWSKPTIDAAKAAGLEVLTVGRHGDFLTLKRVEHERFRQRAEIVAGGELHEVDLPLAGDFQIYNALVSAGLAAATGTPVAKALAALEHLKGAPGRLDLAARPRTARLSMSTTHTSPTRWKTCSPRSGPSPPAGSSSCSAAAATATAASGRSWARSPPGLPTSSSSPTTIRAPKYRPISARRSLLRHPARSRSRPASGDPRGDRGPSRRRHADRCRQGP